MTPIVPTRAPLAEPWSPADAIRELRVLGRQLIGAEPVVRRDARPPLEFHGNAAGGWCIVRDSLRPDAVVVDVGLGEDASFPESLIRTYGCVVQGFDPTPRAIRYVRELANDRLRLFELGLGPASGTVTFYLPNDAAHVSGSVHVERHLGREAIDVALVTVDEVFELVQRDRIDLLKLDIEGTEYEVLESESFRRRAPAIGQLCVEFHHRWESRGRASTERAVRTLRSLGFECVWRSRRTNEEFTFARPGWSNGR